MGKPKTSAMPEMVRLDEVREFLDLIGPGRAWTLAAIGPHAGARMRACRFTDAAAANSWLLDNQGRNLYFGLNLSEGMGKPKEAEMSHVVGLHVDIDPTDQGDNYEERQAILSRLLEYQQPPTCIVDSGNGYQALWMLNEPVPIGEGPGQVSMQDARARNIGLAQELGGDNCHNLDRLLRLPGTMNLPNARKRMKGRTPQPARLLPAEYRPRYDLTDFRIAEGRQGFVQGIPEQVQWDGELVELNDLRTQFPHLDEFTFEVIETGAAEFDPEHPPRDTSRSGFLFRAVYRLLQGKVPESIIKAVLLDGRYGIAAATYAANRRPEAQADHWIHQAKGHLRIFSRREADEFREEGSEPAGTDEADTAAVATQEDADLLTGNMLTMQQEGLAEMNSRYAVVKHYAGKCLVLRTDFDTPALMSVQSLRDAERNRKIPASVVMRPEGPQLKFRPLGDWWLENERRRQFDTIGFRPGGGKSGEFNLYTGFAIEPDASADSTPITDHLWRIICRGNDAHFTYLMQWLAATVKWLEEPGGCAVVLQGKKGTGKSTVGRILARIFGRHYLQLSSTEQAFGKFNAHLGDKCVVFLDEAYWARDKRNEGALKRLITEPTIFIEPKGLNGFLQPNSLNVLMASNEEFVVPATSDERRFFCLEVSDEMYELRKSEPAKAVEYFTRLHEAIDGEGCSGFLAKLLKVDLKKYDKFSPPATGLLAEQVVQNMTPKEAWLDEVLSEGSWFPDGSDWSEQVTATEVVESWQEWRKRNNDRFAPPNPHLRSFLLKAIPGVGCTHQLAQYVPRANRRAEDYAAAIPKLRRVYQFPDLDTCRAVWQARFPGGA